MTNDEILKLAKGAGLQTYITRDCYPSGLIRFALLAAAAELEYLAGEYNFIEDTDLLERAAELRKEAGE